MEEFELVEVAVGKRYPFEDVLEKLCTGDEGGASLNYLKETKTLCLYVAIPKPTNAEIRSFRNDPIRFRLYRNQLLNTSLIMACFGVDFMFDLLYDINVVDIDMDGQIDGNRFDMYLIDTTNGIVKGIRSIGLGKEFMGELNHITRNDGRYTTRQYNEWLTNEIFKKPLQQLWFEADRIDWDV